jgi:hypothetical protein
LPVAPTLTTLYWRSLMHRDGSPGDDPRWRVHNVGGWALADGGVVIDFSGMRGVRVDSQPDAGGGRAEEHPAAAGATASQPDGEGRSAALAGRASRLGST